MKIRTLASGLTHLVFISLFVLGVAKHAKGPGSADAGDTPRAESETNDSPHAKTASMVAAHRTVELAAKRENAAGDTAPGVPDVPPLETEGSNPDTAADTSSEPAARDGKTADEDPPLSRNERLMRRLVAAYPEFLAGYEGNTIIWHDGTRMPFDDGRDKSFKQRLTDPDLEDQFYTEYPRGLRGVPPLEDIDPGRVRYEPFFVKMYGDCKQDKAAMRDNLEEVVWLPDNYGKTLRVTSVNGVADALREVSAALDKLPKKFMKYLRPSAGTYNCRTIAGTDRFSVHAFGAAFDINAKYGDYWRWSQTEPGESLVYRNRVPWEIVEIFEQHGFIWGGKWYHYDTMHFEYRPELLNAEPRPPAPLPEKRRRPPRQQAER
ncbi:MAG: M15 family metallopeptidase [Dichotomicrobium sp.]